MRKLILFFAAIIMCAFCAQSAGANWAGSYIIEGGIYKGPTTTISLTLKSSGTNTFSGTIKMEESDGYDGTLTGKVTAKVENGVLVVTLVSHSTRSGENGNCVKDVFKNNSKILIISRSGYNHQVTPLGTM